MQQGRTIVITGCGSGIGLCMAQQLLASGHRIIGVCRTGESAEAARQALGSDRLTVLVADLASQRGVRILSDEILAAAPTVDVLINNAACVSGRRMLTEDGIELQLAVNHLAPVLLTGLLLPALKRSAQGRVVNVSSRAHARGRVHWDDLMLERGYSLSTAYNQSKLCNLMWTSGLAEELKGTGITVNAFHPGLVNTTIGEKRTSAFEGFLWRMIKLLGSKPSEAAEDGVWLATDGTLSDTTGGYFHRKRRISPSAAAMRAEDIERIMGMSATLIR